MNALIQPATSSRPDAGWLPWWPIILGLAVLFIPTWWFLANHLWDTEEQGHGPIVLVVTLYLLWTKRSVLTDPSDHTQPILGFPILVIGLLLYILGRSQDILLFEVSSQIPILFGVVLITRGVGVARALWFPITFLIFMVPLPGFVVDSLTGPLKAHVSELTESLLYAVGYPIARSGVTLSIGPYELLVADACSGLHSIFSLSALGLLYVYLIRITGMYRVLLLLTVIPIAFMANVARVVILVLITYYFGDEAGQGFAHKFAGIALFIAAVLLMIGVDNLMTIGFRKKP